MSMTMFLVILALGVVVLFFLFGNNRSVSDDMDYLPDWFNNDRRRRKEERKRRRLKKNTAIPFSRKHGDLVLEGASTQSIFKPIALKGV